MLIPLRHESMRGRRWPIITFVLIGLNILIFLMTHGAIEEQAPQRAEVRVHLIILAALHPELKTSGPATVFISGLKDSLGERWESIASPSRQVEDPWDAEIRRVQDPIELQGDMDELCQEFEAVEQGSILNKYAYVPAHPRAISYVTANFLHGGWIHLIGNMWFLWLAGFILEDTWGRVIYPLFYLVAGAAALQFYGWCAHGSYLPLIGASGAVAALMGAFLVRFPKMKIEMLLFLIVFRIRFKAPAYWLLPLWLAMEFFYGSALGTTSPVAHWAHVGGFLFGMAGAFALQQSGMEQKANDAIESKLSWSGAPEVVQASEAMERGKLDEAASILQKHVAANPNSADALNLLQQAHWRRNDMAAYRDATVQLCQVYLKNQDQDNAWRAFEEYQNAGGDKMPAATWLEIIRSIEAQQHFDRAVSEYERIAEAYPTEKQSLLAQLAAGRLCLKRLNRPEAALKFYKAAAASKVPHLDWEANIQAGIQDADRAMMSTTTGSAH
jgi:membrane associated rhomboid family serine protease